MNKILENKTCKQCFQSFPIYQEDRDFYEKISPSFGGEKFQIPDPILCPDCRQIWRISFRNERNLYSRVCNASGKNIISLYPPDSCYKVYSQDIWNSDSWDPISYGCSYEDNIPFFTQMQKLLIKVPKKALYGYSNTNADFTNDCTHCKDCFLMYSSDYCENCYYGLMQNSKNSIDCFECGSLQECYECSNCDNLHNVQYAINSRDCKNSQFILSCHSCEDCFLCSNLVGQKYCIENIQYSQEEYKNKIGEYSSHTENINIFKNLYKISYHRASKIYNSENCVGNQISHSSNCFHCFDVNNTQDSRYVFYGSLGVQDCLDTAMASLNATLCYNSQCCLEGCHKIIGCNFCINVSESYYLDNCMNCENCFGCVGLKNKKYCILNKQYSKDEYYEIIQKIIIGMIKLGEWGSFFPPSISPFGYNISVANDYYPREREEIVKLGWTWSDYEPRAPKVGQSIPAHKLPENISDIPDDICNWAIVCETSGKPFRIIPQELEFYRKHTLSIPKKHPDVRHMDRMNSIDSRKIRGTQCNLCHKYIQTACHSSISNILCDTCYDGQVFG